MAKRMEKNMGKWWLNGGLMGFHVFHGIFVGFSGISEGIHIPFGKRLLLVNVYRKLWKIHHPLMGEL